MTEHVIPELDRKGLREFGLVTGGVVAGLFGLFFPWLLDRSWPLWPWVVFGVLGTWGLVAPMSLQPVYRTWMRFGLMLSKVMTPLIMGIVFFLLITPVAIVLKIFGKDPMAREFDNSASYRVPTEKAPPENLERPY
ncbi:MAG: sxtJ [Gammaproteobacteria bacterium]|nr:sxtJ [Gammaproteobacteria bacterium]